jgi:hypothetical protein
LLDFFGFTKAVVVVVVVLVVVVVKTRVDVICFRCILSSRFWFIFCIFHQFSGRADFSCPKTELPTKARKKVKSFIFRLIRIGSDSSMKSDKRRDANNESNPVVILVNK